MLNSIEEVLDPAKIVLLYRARGIRPLANTLKNEDCTALCPLALISELDDLSTEGIFERINDRLRIVEDSEALAHFTCGFDNGVPFSFNTDSVEAGLYDLGARVRKALVDAGLLSQST